MCGEKSKRQTWLFRCSQTTARHQLHFAAAHPIELYFTPFLAPFRKVSGLMHPGILIV
jgi:hypothetical protein